MKLICTALLLIAVTRQIYSLSCRPCGDLSKCPKLNCPGGEVPGLCLCCNRCAKLEGEVCGGDFGIDGECDQGLTCLKDEKTVRRREGPALVSSPITRRGKCVRPVQSCQEVCDSYSAYTQLGLSYRGQNAYLKPSFLKEGFWASCDCSEHRAWMVIQRRVENTYSFDVDFKSYKNGFGASTTDFWLGLDRIHKLTNTQEYEMKILARFMIGSAGSAVYPTSFADFKVGGENESYELSLTPALELQSISFSQAHSGKKFSAKDRDNDNWERGSCAQMYGGGWWYDRCTEHNLNGIMYGVSPGNEGYGPDAMTFGDVHNYKVVGSEIWIRPKPNLYD